MKAIIAILLYWLFYELTIFNKKETTKIGTKKNEK